MRPDPRRAARPGAALLLALAVLGSPVVARAAAPTPQEEVEGRLMCYCGCSDLTVRVCSCGTAARIKDDIAHRLASGQTPDQIVEAYVSEHGEQIRSAPKAEGFNLLAWIMPFAAILAGAWLVVGLTRRWKAQPGAGPDAPAGEAGDTGRRGEPGQPGAAQRDALRRVEREMREDM